MKQFSILNVLLVVALVCACLGLYISQSRLQRLFTETQSLRDELGLFRVGNKNTVHIRAINPKYKSIWRFQMFLPESMEFDYGVGEVPITKEGTIDFSSIEKRLLERQFAFVDLPLRGNFVQSFSLDQYRGEFHFSITSSSRSQSHSNGWDRPHYVSGFTHRHACPQANERNFSTHLLWDIAPRFRNSREESPQHGNVHEIDFDQPVVLAMLDLQKGGPRVNGGVKTVYVFALIPKDKKKRKWSMNDIADN